MKRVYNGITVADGAYSILLDAATRERGNLCPNHLKANAETVVLHSLERKGLIVDAAKSPFITQAGIDFVAHCEPAAVNNQT